MQGSRATTDIPSAQATSAMGLVWDGIYRGAGQERANRGIDTITYL